MKVRILAASDRNNYGDLLFPILIKKYLGKEFQNYSVLNYGIIESDLTDFGALPTLSFGDLVKASASTNEKSILIVGGGEVLGGGWLNINRFINPFWNSIYHNRYSRFLFNKFKLLERFNITFNSSSRPFILDGKNFNRNDIYYNSVGALGVSKLLSAKNNIQKYFKEINHLSVRDSRSQEAFAKHGIKAELVPDSALIMSDLLGGELEEKVSNSCKNIAKSNYIFLQLGNNKGPDDLNLFLEKLDKFSHQLDLKVLLCPIGLALDHGDDVLLKKINKLQPDFEYYHPENLYEIMYLLKHAKLYLGTSLHGLITAQSFNVPFFMFPEKISKLKIYIDTWFANSERLYGNFNDFEKANNRYESFNEKLENAELEKQKRLIYQNYQRIFTHE